MAAAAGAASNEVVLLNERLAQRKSSTYPELSNSEYFLISSIDTVLRARELSSRQIEDGIVEGSDDGGIDAVYLFVDGQLVEDASEVSGGENPRCELEIFQVKEERGFKETVLQRLMDHLPLLLQLEVQQQLTVEFNPRVLERIEAFRKVYFQLADRFPELIVRVRYVTKSAELANEKVLAKSDRLKAKVRQSFTHAQVSVEMIGAQELNTLARQRKSSTLTLRVTEGPISPEKGGLVCLVSIADYFSFITKGDGRLRDEVFEENVRDYEGDTVINKGISESLRQGDGATADFWWLNNGVTILGKKVQLANKRIVIDDAQIVNGLQTSRSIHQYFHSASRKSGDTAPAVTAPGIDGARQILVRVIEAEDETLSAQIIKATNSQNRVSAASLRAAEPFQRDIEEYFLRRGLYYERKKNYYKNLGKPRSEIVEVLELAQAVASILLQQPDVARGRPSSLVKGKPYDKVFGQTTPLAAYWNCFQVLKKVDSFLVRNFASIGRHERSNIRFHLARAACAFALPSSRPRPRAVAGMELGVIDDDFLHPILKWLLDARKRAGKESGVSDTNVLAKGPEWTAEIDRMLSRYTDKTVWPKRLVARS